MKRPVVLVGFSGCGKSSVVRVLARRVEVDKQRLADGQRLAGGLAIDLDREIETQVGCSIEEYIRVEGEAEFRRREAQAFMDAIHANAEFIAAGGGILLSAETRQLVEKHGWLIELWASPEVIVNRVLLDQVEAGARHRPLLFSDVEMSQDQLKSRIREMYDIRRSGYEKARIRIVTDYADAESCAESLSMWAEKICIARAGKCEEKLCLIPTRLSAAHGRSEILIGAGARELLPVAIAARLKSVRKVAVVTDAQIEQFWLAQCVEGLRAAGLSVIAIVLPPGETAKTLANVELAASKLLAEGFTRSDLVIALGGGVVGDLGGLLASLYMRGVNLIQLPTTLLAQVDSAIGGKTGVDLEGGKNSLGTFYPAKLVLSDPTFLSTLPDREFRSGIAEVVKYGLVWSADLLQQIEKDLDRIVDRDHAVMHELIENCTKAKLDFVTDDLTDLAGKRAILNFGHTIGHAIERLTGYSEFLHGEAISIGMAFALRFGVAQGWTDNDLADRVEKLLVKLGLPTRPPSSIRASSIRASSIAIGGDSTESVSLGASLQLRDRWFESLQADKKRASDDVQFVVVEAPGRARLSPVPVSLLVESVSNLKGWS